MSPCYFPFIVKNSSVLPTKKDCNYVSSDYNESYIIDDLMTRSRTFKRIQKDPLIYHKKPIDK